MHDREDRDRLGPTGHEQVDATTEMLPGTIHLSQCLRVGVRLSTTIAWDGGVQLEPVKALL